MNATPDLSGRYGCPLGAAQRATLLAEQEAELSAVQAEVARQYLESVTWVLDLHADGTFESIWEVGHGADAVPIPGHWTVDDGGRAKLMFVDEAPWIGTLSRETLRFTHPEVGAVEMTRLEQ